ncbi:hypothetical protein JAAARDRAFT_32369 [Jaapia argillacea MUCL 33604]|uniref:Uncharacterized protein n=1 Tax=Jaapia argillacea MUCL 33604 TaxID=933084 RepID=A0A067QBN8_9AGAM|nr:hypothetical protein JAAARDRAFT_32369 [Jaapia argillacea MUCL 33604]
MTQLSAPTSSESPARSEGSEHTSPQVPVPGDIATSMHNLSVAGSDNANPFVDTYAPPSGPPPAQATVATPPSYDNLSIHHNAPAHAIDEKSGSEWVDEKAHAPIENQRTAPIIAPPILSQQPPSFSRPAPSNLPYTAFPPLTIYLGKGLGDGFPTTLPPTAHVDEPHPFTSHDIQESDWLSFLGSIKEVGSLSGGEKIVGNPLVLGIAGGLTFGVAGGVTGAIIAKGVHHRMMKKKYLAIGELINIWNQTFFHPRKMEVILAKGPERLSGPTGQCFPPDWEVESKKMEFVCGGCCGRKRRGMRGEAEGLKSGDEESKLHRTTTGSSTSSSSSAEADSEKKESESLHASPTSKYALKAQKQEMKQALKTQCAAWKAQARESGCDKHQLREQIKSEAEAIKVQCQELKEMKKAGRKARKEMRRRGEMFRLVVVSIA